MSGAINQPLKCGAALDGVAGGHLCIPYRRLHLFVATSSVFATLSLRPYAFRDEETIKIWGEFAVKLWRSSPLSFTRSHSFYRRRHLPLLTAIHLLARLATIKTWGESPIRITTRVATYLYLQPFILYSYTYWSEVKWSEATWSDVKWSAVNRNESNWIEVKRSED